MKIRDNISANVGAIAESVETEITGATVAEIEENKICRA
jgi:hypothetical protein